jgi:hypothetical protein
MFCFFRSAGKSLKASQMMQQHVSKLRLMPQTWRNPSLFPNENESPSFREFLDNESDSQWQESDDCVVTQKVILHLNIRICASLFCTHNIRIKILLLHDAGCFCLTNWSSSSCMYIIPTNKINYKWRMFYYILYCYIYILLPELLQLTAADADTACIPAATNFTCFNYKIRISWWVLSSSFSQHCCCWYQFQASRVMFCGVFLLRVLSNLHGISHNLLL